MDYRCACIYIRRKDINASFSILVLAYLFDGFNPIRSIRSQDNYFGICFMIYLLSLFRWFIVVLLFQSYQCNLSLQLFSLSNIYRIHHDIKYNASQYSILPLYHNANLYFSHSMSPLIYTMLLIVYYPFETHYYLDVPRINRIDF